MEFEVQNKVSLRFITLGCPKNLVDSEAMLGMLSREHFVLHSDGSPADVGIVNTCGFIEASKKESIDTILELAEEKKRGHVKLIVVAGCLAQRFASTLPDLLPEVDLFIGTADFSRLPSLISQKLALPLRGDTVNFIRSPSELVYSSTPRIPLTPPHTRYVKISEGCSHTCSFCTIPLMRGGLMSRPSDDILLEINKGLENGVKEFNFIAQDLNEYGRDLWKGAGRESLYGLLEKLADIDGDFWIRLLYMYPLQFPDRLIRLIKDHPHIVPYVDIPLQHIDDGILKSMNRGSSARYIYRLIEKLKKEIPEIILRTTFITGYPGETDEAFERLHSFVKEAEFDRMGVFTYSQEESTPAADLKDQIPQKIKEERRHILMSTQQKISLSKNRTYIGKTLKVLYEGNTDGHGIGRYYGQAPEIDGNVLIRMNKANRTHPMPSDFTDVTITDAQEYDLVGQA